MKLKRDVGHIPLLYYKILILKNKTKSSRGTVLIKLLSSTFLLNTSKMYA